MPDTPMHKAATVDDGFEVVVEQFLREREEGSNPDRQRYLESFPQFTALLRDFFAGQDLFDRLAPDLAPAIRPNPPTASRATPSPGERVGGFELIEELGRGGMGVVYRARQTNLGRTVAIKMIRSQDEAELARFRVESEAIARLQHANIVQLFEVGERDGTPFLAMEYCAGGSLEQRLHGTALLPAESAGVVAALARAMQAAHQQNVIHRDLKPANVLLAGGGAETPLDRLTPKVTDFGLARKLDDPGLTQSGVIMGTPSYLAPEQASGRSKEVGPAADIYALGAVLYECLTGRPPFRAATTLDTLAQVLDAYPVSPRQLNPAVPRDLETVCLKCLEKEPRRRYADAAALADDLDRYLAGRPVQARRVGLAERLLRWARRRPAAAGLAAAVILLAAGAGVAGWWYQQEQLALASRQAKEDVRKAYLNEEVTAALDRSEHGLKELHQALNRLLPDENHPLAVSVLLSDLRRWEVRVQAARATHLRATKLSESNPEALAPEQRARLEQLGALVEQAEADYQIARQLDRIRLEAATLVDGKFDEAHTGLGYEKVFREQLHLDLRNGSVPELAEQTKNSALRYALTAALDHWADVTADGHLRLRLLEVTRLADPDPWRDQVREASTWQNLTKLQHLAGAVQPAEQTPQVLALLARRLSFQGDRPGAASLLRTALVHYPADFWLNFELGFRSDEPGEQLGCYRAALAARPDSALVLNNLGYSLRRKKDLPGAIACLTRAIELDPKFALAHNNLLGALREGGDVDSAIVAYKRLLERAPTEELYTYLVYLLRAKKDLAGAIATLEEAVRFEPGSAAPPTLLGDLLRDAGRLDEAERAYREAVRLDGDHHGAAIDSLGMLLYCRRKYDDALVVRRQAVRLDPENAQVHLNLAETLYASGDVDGSIAEYRAGIQIDPKACAAHNNLGVILSRDKHDLKEAIDEFTIAIRLNPIVPAGHINLGIALIDKKDFEAAIKSFRRAIEIDPQSAPARCGLGRALYGQGKAGEAMACFCKAIDLDPKFLDAYCHLAQALADEGKLDEAIDRCLKAIDIDPACAHAHNSLGILYCEHKQDYSRAVACFEKAITLAPKVAAHHFNLGNAKFRMGKADEAIASFRTAIQLDKKVASAHCNLGIALRRTGKVDEGIDCLRKAIEIDPNFAVAHFNLGVSLQEKGMEDESITCYRKAIEIDAKYTVAHCNLGFALTHKGKLDKAIDSFRKAIEIDPNFVVAHGGLGQALLGMGRFAEARDACARAVSLLPANDPRRGPASRQVETCTQLLQLEKRLPRVLSGEDRPNSPGQALTLAWICRLRRLHVAATRLAADALRDPQLPADLVQAHRYNAACSAALSSAGQVEDADKLSDPEKSQLRRHALTWLRAELTGLAAQLNSDPKQTTHVQHKLQWWQTDPDLAGVRDTKALAQLPEGERTDWQKLWADVAATLTRAQQQGTPPEKPTGPGEGRKKD
jgi:serine/threonine-protein kinase